MKLLFSEYSSDYDNYIFPYAIWAVPDAGEAPSTIFARGFLPASRNLDRFYMCRQVRTKLSEFERSSENRRILRKCENVSLQLIPREDFAYTEERRNFYKKYADEKFGKDKMSFDRLDSLFNSAITSHVMLFTDTSTGKEVGTVTLYLEPKNLVFYYYAFYDLDYYSKNLGMYMMTSTVDYFAHEQFEFIYLGSCYSRNALYKTQFKGAEFFNGVCWSENIAELKYLIERDRKTVTNHLLEEEAFYNTFYNADKDSLLAYSLFHVD